MKEKKKRAKQYNYNGIKGCVIQRQNETKGILFSVYHCKQRKVFPNVMKEMVKWATACEHHGEKVFTDNLNDARDLMRTSEKWCFGCFQAEAKNSNYLITIPLLDRMSFYCHEEETPIYLNDRQIGTCYIQRVHNGDDYSWRTYGKLLVSEIPEDHYMHVNFTGSTNLLYLTHIFFDQKPQPTEAGRSITFKDCLYKN